MIYACRVWTSRSRLEAFVLLGRTTLANRQWIEAFLDERASNARVEPANIKLRELRRQAFGFYATGKVIELAMQTLGDFCRPVPCRIARTH